MPRFVQRRQPLSPREVRERANVQRVQSGAFEFYDNFPSVLGTKPEKIVYDELVSRGIPFRFQDYAHVYIKYFINKWYRPDFILPYDKVIIEVQGGYWHSMPKTIKKDAYKIALYRIVGWRVLVWWDYEIEGNIDDLFMRDLYRPRKLVAPFKAALKRKYPRKKRKDDSAGIRTLNRKRARSYKRKPVRTKVRGSRRVYKPLSSRPASR